MRDMAQLRLQVGDRRPIECFGLEGTFRGHLLDAGSSLKTGRVVAEMSETRKGRGSSLLHSHTEAVSLFCKDRIVENLKLEGTHKDHRVWLPAPRRAA